MSSPVQCAYSPIAATLSLQSTARALLAPAELAYYETLRSDHQRAPWIAGRAAAKRLIQQVLREESHSSGRHLIPAERIEIRSRTIAGLRMRPQVFAEGTRIPSQLSIAHTTRAVLVALCPCDLRIGVDLVDRIQGRFAGLRAWFTPAERIAVAARAARAPLVWGVKEAVYKACNRGEAFAPRRVESWVDSAGNVRCRYRDRDLSDGGSVQSWQVDRHIAVLFTLRSPPHAAAASRFAFSSVNSVSEIPSDD